MEYYFQFSLIGIMISWSYIDIEKEMCIVVPNKPEAPCLSVGMQ